MNIIIPDSAQPTVPFPGAAERQREREEALAQLRAETAEEAAYLKQFIPPANAQEDTPSS